MSKKNCSKIGGQAVIEGVMMRGKSVLATAVRDPSGAIQIESSRFTPYSERSVFYKIPVIRGVVNFVTSMAAGMKTLMRATEVYGDISDTEPSKFEKWLEKYLKIDIVKAANFIGVILGLALSMFLFVFLPNVATDGFYKLVPLDRMGIPAVETIIKNLTSGVIRISIFVFYIFLTSKIKDINRLYRYHGAEHKTISAYEQGLPLTVQNVQKMTTVHDRCGTTFLFLVMIISIVFFSFFGWQVLWQRILIRLAGIPVVAGLCYELIMILAKYDNFFARMMKAPGLWLQKLTTKEPDDGMVEVAITAFNTVLNMEEDKTIAETTFVTVIPLSNAKDRLITLFGDNKYYSEIDIILIAVSGAEKKSDLTTVRIKTDMLEKAEKIVQKRLTGMPLQYAIGSTCFYGYDFKTDKRALIPRFDTELLAEQAIKAAALYKNPKVWELCTGSGAVAIAIKKNIEGEVYASDISEEALSLAKENAEINGADVRFFVSDMFASGEGQYDIIVINPPYIPTEEIDTLDAEVKDYEPRAALDGGIDGLDFYKIIASEYKKYLNEGGVLLLEIGKGQKEEMEKLFPGCAFTYDYNTPSVARIVTVK